MQKYDLIIDNSIEISDSYESNSGCLCPFLFSVTVKVMNTIMVFTFCKRYVIKLHELRYVVKLHELQYFSYFPGNVLIFFTGAILIFMHI